MKVGIIGSTRYQEVMSLYAHELRKEGVEAYLPHFDARESEIKTCQYNLEMIKKVDEVRVFWDGHSLGAVFDFGMAFALGKPVGVVRINERSFANLMRQYENATHKEIP